MPRFNKEYHVHIHPVFIYYDNAGGFGYDRWGNYFRQNFRRQKFFYDLSGIICCVFVGYIRVARYYCWVFSDRRHYGSCLLVCFDFRGNKVTKTDNGKKTYGGILNL